MFGALAGRMARKAQKTLGVRKGSKGGWTALPKLHQQALDWQKAEARLLKGREYEYKREQTRKRTKARREPNTSAWRAEGCWCGAVSWRAECPVHGLKERG